MGSDSDAFGAGVGALGASCAGLSRCAAVANSSRLVKMSMEGKAVVGDAYVSSAELEERTALHGEALRARLAGGVAEASAEVAEMERKLAASGVAARSPRESLERERLLLEIKAREALEEALRAEREKALEYTKLKQMMEDAMPGSENKDMGKEETEAAAGEAGDVAAAEVQASLLKRSGARAVPVGASASEAATTELKEAVAELKRLLSQEEGQMAQLNQTTQAFVSRFESVVASCTPDSDLDRSREVGRWVTETLSALAKTTGSLDKLPPTKDPKDAEVLRALGILK